MEEFNKQDEYNELLTLFDSEEEVEQYFSALEQMQFNQAIDMLRKACKKYSHNNLLNKELFI